MNPPKWVGASRASSPSSPYFWVNYERLHATLWNAGEPNYHSHEPACAYTPAYGTKLSDAPCGNHNSYTCEKCKNPISFIL